MYVKAFKVNVNKCLKPLFLEKHINIVNTVTLQSFWYISSLRPQVLRILYADTGFFILMDYFMY